MALLVANGGYISNYVVKKQVYIWKIEAYQPITTKRPFTNWVTTILKLPSPNTKHCDKQTARLHLHWQKTLLGVAFQLNWTWLHPFLQAGDHWWGIYCFVSTVKSGHYHCPYHYQNLIYWILHLNEFKKGQ